MSTNPELELAHQYVSQTDRHIFLTGKAGTGKTTFLHRIRESVPKRKVVVAPTGVAAINARGVTIHSQFQLPFGVLTAARIEAEMRTHRLSRKKAEVLRSLDLLVIDEISMVRADVLDALSAVLRKYRSDDRPFGGVQLLMIGDLHQLPPVVRDEEWQQLRGDYETPYFFGSRELARAGVVTIQLRHIYRQSDATFIELLNRVRHDRLDAATLAQLNSRYRGPEFQPAAGEDYITLTSHNRTANAINERQLATLSAPLHKFEAKVTGTFPASMYPNDPELEFRVGAQVMFNKNDTAEHRYFNGKIGRITAITGNLITVECPGEEEAIEVTPVEWENRKYELNAKTKEVNDEVIGTYSQHPLRLAWAITIHKSQGLTFDRVIIDAADAFAHGQVYVALSRCKTFEGIVLRSRIGDHSVKTDRVVRDYSSRAEEEVPTAEDLREDRRRYQLNCLGELLDFTALEQAMALLERALFEHERSIQGEGLAQTRELRKRLEEEVIRLCRSFRGQLRAYAGDAELPADHPELAGRLKKAGAYLLPLLESVYADLGQLSFMSDNQKVYETVSDRLKSAARELAIKLRTFKVVRDGFDPDGYQRARADATLDFERQQTKRTTTVLSSTETAHPELYAQLAQWRNRVAEASGLPPYRILHNTVLLSISNFLPANERSLLAVPGFGPRSLETYGKELLDLIDAYARSRAEPVSRGQAAKSKLQKEDTRLVTLQLTREGKSVAEIAAARKLSESTIYGHLAHWIERGELAPTEVMEKKRLKELVDYLTTTTEDQPLREIYDHFEQAYDYGEIRIGMAARQLG
ncbi:hypothetical protein GGR26_000322 [Lewinella marina]|uniref:HRDC domain-containing protein n=1 Tax=Neolewinella marina TaxID=438751 RepID=A0A2G0CJV2_9BACT|nr:helix-turn-helix domain-containing protein [Neolewinella marina]NJB84577.1 hypothetical protein [Neolewinella marina]PHL00242.1 hypothetical protein CGL56_04180 [Neolewinella marina]